MPFPEGVFYIRSRKRGWVLDIEDGSLKSDANLIVWQQKKHGASNQLWVYDDGFLLNAKSGLALDVRGGRLQSNTPIIQYTPKENITIATNQLWDYHDGFIFPQAHSNLVLDIKGDSKLPGAKVILYDRKPHDNLNQQWELELCDDKFLDIAGIRPQDIGIREAIHHVTSKLTRMSTIVDGEQGYDGPSPAQIRKCHKQIFGKQPTSSPSPYDLASACAAQAIQEFEEPLILEGRPTCTQYTRPALSSLTSAVVAREAKARHMENDVPRMQTGVLFDVGCLNVLKTIPDYRRGQFTEITIACREQAVDRLPTGLAGKGRSYSEADHKLQTYLNRTYQGSINASLEVLDEDVGTADALRSIASRIEKDFIVLTSDLVTELNPTELLDHHRLNRPTLTTFFYRATTAEGIAGGKDQEDEVQYVGVDRKESRLVHVVTQSDDDDLQIRTKLLWQFPNISMHTDLRDAHVYIFQRWVLNLLVAKPRISSIRQDLVPFLVKCQYQSKLVDREEVISYQEAHAQSELNDASGSSVLSELLRQDELVTNGTTEEASSIQKAGIRVQVLVCKEGFTARANTIQSYCEINRYLTRPASTITRIASSAEISNRTQVGNDSIVGASTKIDERTSVKRSAVGAHCTIGKNVKITNCIIMDNVVVEDNAKLDGCVICNNANIMERAHLKDCEVSGGYIVDKDFHVKGEKLVAFREAI
ncbi:hypothetical protein BZG36_02484 [Bifiguratus adelaidae]|uniref:Translation initiation factor eIF2B subunit gamma n=1 Tax=Bifiguratus adelaidae TaxID=1938954 RepID=A0A261Y0V1_9FUNG|nr:hypothetical protein BZG36_02484 [Bifiguratus adelaidae]